MPNYFETVKGQDLDTLKSDPQFQDDLIRFFGSKRYNMSSEEMKKQGLDGLYNKYLEHMRYQAANEWTTGWDLYFVRDKENVPPEDLDAYARLIQAWDNSDSAGDGTLSMAGDYLAATLSAPSTIAGMVTAGIGTPLAKLTSFTAEKGAQLAIRKVISGRIAEMVAATAAKEQVSSALMKGATRGALTEAAIAAVQQEGNEQVREELIDDYKRNWQQYWVGTGLAAVTGGVLGGASRGYSVSKQNKAFDLLERHHAMKLAEQVDATAAADLTLAKEGPAKDAALKSMTDYVNINSSKLGPLDPQRVAEGEDIAESIFKGEGVKAGLSLNTVKRITAAATDLGTEIDIQPGERITSAISRSLEDGTIDDSVLEGIRKKYALSREDFSKMFLADLSEAGKVLAEGSKASRALTKARKDAIATQVADLGKRSSVSVGEEELANLSKKADKEGWSFVNFLRELDAMRIGFLTSQPATTAANFASSGGRLVLDASDTFFKNLLTDPTRNPFRGTLSAVKGISIDRDQVEVLRFMLEEDAPVIAKDIFKNASRVENATGSQSILAKFTRGINVLNTVSDGVFKEGIFYASIDRQLMAKNDPALGLNFFDFSQKHARLDDLPSEFIDRAKLDALGFVYQKGFQGEDNFFANTARTVMKVHKDIPFVVSSVVPFPRYIANQLEVIHDYTPFVGLITAGLEKASGVQRSASKTTADRLARQATGALAFMGAYYLRASMEGTTEPFEVPDPVGGNTASLERIGGPGNTTMVIADAIYRWKNNMSPPELSQAGSDALKAATGTGFMGYNESFLQSILDSTQQGEWTQDSNKLIGDFASTFTFPLAIVKDFVGQIHPEDSNKPYTKDVYDQPVDILGQIKVRAEAANRAMRFTWDSEDIQYLQSFDGKNDIKMYSPFNPEPVRVINPLVKQLTGVNLTPPLTDLQIEMRRLNMKEWLTYKNSTVANPAVDVVVRKRLAKNLSKDFRSWRADSGYSTIDDPAVKKILLNNWIRTQISQEEEYATNAFAELQRTKPKLAAGYTRNQYRLKEQEDKLDYDQTVEIATNGQYKTAEEYYTDVETVEQELARRLQIMSWAGAREKELTK